MTFQVILYLFNVDFTASQKAIRAIQHFLQGLHRQQAAILPPWSSLRLSMSKYPALSLNKGHSTQLYVLQVALLQQKVASRGWSETEVLTIDKCQGVEKPVLLLSFVRSNEELSPGQLLEDWRRINVAITRAQKKLVMVGSAQTLRQIPLFEELLNIVQGKDWLVRLPADILKSL